MKKFTDKINESVEDKIPSAEDFLLAIENIKISGGMLTAGSTIKAMIEFAKLHVEAALQAALENSETYMDGSSVFNEFESSILNAYPLDNIK